MTWDDFERGTAGNGAGPIAAARPRAMTVAGSINATLVLLAICIASAAVTWSQLSAHPGMIMIATLGATVVGLVATFAIPRMPRLAPVTAPLFAVVEGIFVGAVSLVYAKYFGTNPGGPGLITLAVVATFAVTGTMLVLYRFKVIRATPMVKKIVSIGFVSLLVFCVAQLLLRYVFGVTMPFMWDGGPIAIGFCLVVIGLASLSLVVDFDFIEQGAASGLPKQYEWIAGVGLLASMVILYIYILRLLAMLRSNQ
jgi:uncharacterized YccA/Bax inhibitor family protein